MKLFTTAFATTSAVTDPHVWSGTIFHMARALAEYRNADEHFYVVDRVSRQLPAAVRLRRFFSRLCHLPASSVFEVAAARGYSAHLANRLASMNVDAVISPLVNPVAFLEGKWPVVLWTDALYSAMVGFYPQSKPVSSALIQGRNSVVSACLQRCRLAVFSSQWAANTAIDFYGTPPEKVRVIPFGANLDCRYSEQDMQEIVSRRAADRIRLLFVGREWKRKGGDRVLALAQVLHDQGVRVELHLVGTAAPAAALRLPYVRTHGYISPGTPEGLAKMRALYRDSHFFVMFPEAEAYGIVFCEANAAGLPVLASHVGGIPSIVRKGVNGQLFSLEASAQDQARYLLDVMADRRQYEALALSSFREYQARLNWRVAVKTLFDMMGEVL